MPEFPRDRHAAVCYVPCLPPPRGSARPPPPERGPRVQRRHGEAQRRRGRGTPPQATRRARARACWCHQGVFGCFSEGQHQLAFSEREWRARLLRRHASLEARAHSECMMTKQQRYPRLVRQIRLHRDPHRQICPKVAAPPGATRARPFSLPDCWCAASRPGRRPEPQGSSRHRSSAAQGGRARRPRRGTPLAALAAPCGAAWTLRGASAPGGVASFQVEQSSELPTSPKHFIHTHVSYLHVLLDDLSLRCVVLRCVVLCLVASCCVVLCVHCVICT